MPLLSSPPQLQLLTIHLFLLAILVQIPAPIILVMCFHVKLEQDETVCLVTFCCITFELKHMAKIPWLKSPRMPL